MGHMSFRLKLTLVFIVTVMIEGTLIGGFSYYHSRGIVVRNKKQEMSDTINRIDININVKVRYIMEVLDTFPVGRGPGGEEHPQDLSG